jgi:hypothetical protein
VFGGGGLSAPRYSSSLEYTINEADTSLTLTWNYFNSNHHSWSMGNSQRLDNGRTFIGWGSSWNPAATEVEYDGTKTFEMRFDSFFYNYRAFRFPWRTDLLTADSYSIDFQYIPVNTSGTEEIVITNNSNEELEITSNFSRSSLFSITDSFPITLQPYQNRVLQIRFSPDSIGVFSDDIHLRMQKESEMIVQVIRVLGYSDPNAEVEEEENYLRFYKLSPNYPNPFNPTTTIKYQIPEISFVTIKVYDVLGNEIATLVNEEKPAGEYNVEFSAIGGSVSGGSTFALPSGIYFYQLRAGNFIETKKMVILK